MVFGKVTKQESGCGKRSVSCPPTKAGGGLNGYRFFSAILSITASGWLAC